MPTFYVTKYAMTNGIIERDFPAPNNGENYVYGAISDEHMKGCFYIDREAFLSLDDAKANAERQRVKKIESLKKQIAKLEKLTF